MPDSERLVDVALVTVRRLQFLAKTLGSFGNRLFSYFTIARVLANLDPVFGGEDDQRTRREMILARFPVAQVFEPAEASFGAAVRRVWAATRAPVVFHLKDDWLLTSLFVSIIGVFRNT